MKKVTRWSGLLLCFCLMTVLMPFSAVGAAARTAELMIQYEHEKAIFSVYRVADPTGDKTGAFRELDFSLDFMTNAERKAVSEKLAAFAEEERLEPEAREEVSGGTVTFRGLPGGWYLVCGEDVTAGDHVWRAAPFLVSLKENGRVRADVKGEEEPVRPTDPTDPSKPTDPDDPTDPPKPTDPTDPTDPSKPTSPSRPGGSDDDDPDDSDDDRPTRPVQTGDNGPGEGQMDAGTPDGSELAADADGSPGEQRAEPDQPEESIALIPKLGDMGIMGQCIMLAVALAGFIGCLVIFRMLGADEKE